LGVLPPIRSLTRFPPGVFAMKSIVFTIAGFTGLLAVGAALGGAPPAACNDCPPVQQTRCHGRPAMVAAPSGGCHGLNFVAPAAIQAAGCHGGTAGRLTWAERRTARGMARQNYQATLAAARTAGRAGNGIAAMDYSAPAMMMVPAAPTAAAPACQCDCNPCKCGK
jgi:hypothetical protein